MYMIPLSSSRYLCSLYQMVTDSGSPQNEISIINKRINCSSCTNWSSSECELNSWPSSCAKFSGRVFKSFSG